MKTLIIYYSTTGKTEIIANTLSYNLQADIIRVKDLKPRTGFKNKLTASYDAIRETKTEIEPPHIDLNDYDLIYIGTPVWAGKPTPSIITIIDNCDLRGKDVISFATMSNNGGKSTLERIEEKIKARGGRVISSFTVKTKDKSSEKLMEITENLIEILDLKIYK